MSRVKRTGTILAFLVLAYSVAALVFGAKISSTPAGLGALTAVAGVAVVVAERRYPSTSGSISRRQLGLQWRIIGGSASVFIVSLVCNGIVGGTVLRAAVGVSFVILTGAVLVGDLIIGFVARVASRLKAHRSTYQ